MFLRFGTFQVLLLIELFYEFLAVITFILGIYTLAIFLNFLKNLVFYLKSTAKNLMSTVLKCNK